MKLSRTTGIVDVITSFSLLGVTAFGGPTAHIGYFRQQFVERKHWLSDEQFGQLLALCQFLPGPASSQMGFALGFLRAGWLGALMAFTCFTLPSVLLLVFFAAVVADLRGSHAVAAIHGLKLVACVIVADAVMAMWSKLCPDKGRKTLALAVMSVSLLFANPWLQSLLIVVSSGIGWCLFRSVSTGAGGNLPIRMPRTASVLAAMTFVVLFVVLPVVSSHSALFALADNTFRAGALVFGGGHVVLPLLQESFVDGVNMNEQLFLAGYGVSQAIPGPLFTFSAYLGALAVPNSVVSGVVIAVLMIFLPGFLLLIAAFPCWQWLNTKAAAMAAMAGVNAAVVGILAAALYQPITTSAISGVTDVAIAIVGCGILMVWKRSPLWVVLWCVSASLVGAVF